MKNFFLWSHFKNGDSKATLYAFNDDDLRQLQFSADKNWNEVFSGNMFWAQNARRIVKSLRFEVFQVNSVLFSHRD